MNQFKRTTIKLTVIYSIVFFSFIWLFSGGIYLWTNNALGKGYVNNINEIVEQSNKSSSKELSDDTATIAADVALDRMRNIIIVVNSIALILIPTVAYQLSKRSLAPLVKSQEDQEQFISNASHELRTPLAVMAGELELAAKRTRTTEEYQQTIANTSQEVERMTSLVKELLVLARISNHTKLQNVSSFDLKDLLHEVIDLYKQPASKKQITINTDLHTFLLDANRELLTIALVNLLDNAVKFSPNNQTIDIEMEASGRSVTIKFINHGTPIDTKKLSHLFERFYQTDSDHSKQGYGLGLTIAKQIVDLHKGNLLVTSNDAETVFTVTLSNSDRKKNDKSKNES